MQLIARERDLLALRRKHERLGAWLALAQRLPAAVDRHAELPEIFHRIAQVMLHELEFQKVRFFEMDSGGLLRPIALQGQSAEPACPLSVEGHAGLMAEEGGVCQGTAAEIDTGLKAALQLNRFLWYRLDRAPHASILVVAGFDQATGDIRQPFDAADVAHFINAGRQIGLLIGNLGLLRELAQEKQALEKLNLALEERVLERTRKLELTNVELRDALTGLSHREQLLAADIEEARLFQQRVLPTLPSSARIEFAAHYRSLERVGGDMYDVCELAPDRFRIFIVDATGHGVQGSLRTILWKSEYDRLKTNHASPNAVLDELTDRLGRLFPDGEMLSTGACIDLALHEGGALVVFANAANPPLFRWSGGRVEEIYTEGPFLAVESGASPPPKTFTLQRGDLLIACSDGLIEQTNADGEAFEERLNRLELHDEASASAQAALNELMLAFDQFRGEQPLTDDVTVLCLRLR